MKNPKHIWAGIIMAALLLGACSFKHPNALAPIQPTTSRVTNSVVPAYTNSAAVSPAPSVSSNILITPPPLTNASLTNAVSAVISNADVSVTNLEAENEKYKKGQVTKGQMMQRVWAEDNKTPQDFYGKVVDQYGQPVVGASVNGDLMFIRGADVGEGKEVHTTQTDSRGLFQFTGLHGAWLAVAPEKPGYEMGPRGEGYKGPTGEKTSPDDRAIFTMWKLKGAEPMIHSHIRAWLSCDGTPTSFDLVTGRKTSNGGDFTVHLVRNPVDIIRGKHFDWTLTLGIARGGLTEIQEGGYANEAPDEGYLQTLTISMPADTKNWTPMLDRAFFFKSRDGKNYGRMNVHLMADYQPPPTHFEIDAYVNPAGSRNLELDPGKVTQAH